MKTIVLHIGLHKTGTTYLQRALARNVDLLEYHGIQHYIDAQFADEWFGHATVALAARSEPHPVLDLKEDRESVWRRFRSAVVDSRAPVCVVSAEVFLEGVDFDFIRRQLDGFDVRILAYLRDEAELFTSIYYELVKGGADLPIEEFYELSRERVVNFQDRLSGWEAAYGVGTIHLRSYDRTRETGTDLFVDFLRAVDCNANEAWDTPGDRPNQRWSSELVELQRTINGLRVDSSERSNLKDRLCELLAKWKGREVVQPLSLSPEFACRIDEDNRSTNQSFWDRCAEGSILSD
jgi:hypothetical protein